MLVDLKDMEIKKLSEIYDVESRDSFVSFYINMEKTNERFIEKRKKACRAVLKENRDLKENFDKTMLKIEKYLGMNDREEGQKGLAIFASNEHDLFIPYKLGVPVEDLMVVDTCPTCRGNVTPVDVIEESIEFAQRTNTKIEFADDNQILNELGGVGGLLRFKI